MEKKKIIIIDDDELITMSLKMILQADDEFEVVAEGHDGSEALPLYEEMKPDIILMDIRMPVMDGLTAARAIRNSGREDSKTIPIIAVSANAFEDDKKASKDAGMNSHLSKPVDPKLLISEIKKYVCI